METSAQSLDRTHQHVERTVILVIGLGQMVKVKTLRMLSADACQIREHKKATNGRKIAKTQRMEPAEEIVSKTRAIGAIH